MLYIISYDLNAPGQDDNALYDALQSLGANRILKSQWTVNRDNTSCQQLFDYLSLFVDKNDTLLVTAPSAWWASNRIVPVIRNA